MRIPSSLRKASGFTLMAALLMVPGLAYADILSDIADILSTINKEKDESFGMLRSVLGDFTLNPFQTQSGSTGSLLSSMFKDFNMFIFSAACLWMAYNLLAALAQTMHEGVVLGKRMSTVWVPFRIAFGTLSLMPIFGGWAFCQALMVMACLLGIAGANRISNTAISSAAGFETTVNPMGNVKQAAQIHNMELYIARALACRKASQVMAASMAAAGQAASNDFPVVISTVGSDSNVIDMTFAGRQESGLDGASACGKITLSFSPRSNSGVGSMMGFRIEGINYSGIRTIAMTAHAATLNTVYLAAEPIIAGVSSTSTEGQLAAAKAAISQGYFGLYTNTFQAKLAGLAAQAKGASNAGAISEQLTTKMREGGWATLGIWYSVFAEANEAMNEMLDPVVTLQPIVATSSTATEMLDGLGATIDSAQASGVTSATGNTSIGQYIMGGILNGGIGASGTGASNNINPIIAFKNLGDNALTLAQSLYLAAKVVEGFGSSDSKKKDSEESDEPGFVSKLVKKIPIVGGIAGTIAAIADDAKALLVPVAFLLFVTAAVMAFYIPMVPFIQWFAAMIQWFTSVIESLIGSSLWAMAHFDSDGEGMGQRTSYGYTYLLNNFARPIIMTFAFFIASAAINVLGTYLFRYFGSAVASAQGNSLTGLVSIVAYLVIFTVLGLTLVNTTFATMLQLADRMIGWIGSNHSSDAGNDVENKVSMAFLAAGKGATGAIGSKGKQLLDGKPNLGGIAAATTRPQGK